MKRNGLIESLRLLFTFFVLMLHSQYVSNGNEALFRGGWIGVEFFFVLSGFLMARYESSLKPILGKEDRAYDLTRIASDTFRFIRRKIARLFPYFVFALIVNYVIWNIPFSGFSSRFVERGISGLLNFIFAYSAGFRNSDFFYLGYSWYVSAMIIAMWLLFPLLRRNRKMFNYVYAPVIAIMGMGLFAFKYGNLGYVSSDDWVLSNGVLRALCSISLGAISFEFCTQFERIQLTKFGEHTLSLIILLSVGITSYRVIFLKASYINDFLMPFLFAVIIAISFSGKASISFKINKKMSQFLGNFSYALYICSNCWSYFIARIFPEWSYRKAACLYDSMQFACFIDK